MREIKFRAWHKDQGKMYSATELGEDQLTLMPDGRGFANISGDKPSLSRIDNGNKMIPLQYTGLHDKNGTEVYEGDILKYTRYGWKQLGHPKHNTDLVTTYEVFWDSEYRAFRVTNKNMTGSLLFDDSRATKNEIEVIGNIYENPELL